MAKSADSLPSHSRLPEGDAYGAVNLSTEQMGSRVSGEESAIRPGKGNRLPLPAPMASNEKGKAGCLPLQAVEKVACATFSRFS